MPVLVEQFSQKQDGQVIDLKVVVFVFVSFCKNLKQIDVAIGHHVSQILKDDVGIFAGLVIH